MWEFAAGVPRAVVLMDASYGTNTALSGLMLAPLATVAASRASRPSAPPAWSWCGGTARREGLATDRRA
jgi:hypothetical protein